MGKFREERIGGQRLILGDSLEVMKDLGPVDHVISDPPYEEGLHALKSSASKRDREDRPMRIDGGAYLRDLDFASVDSIRGAIVDLVSSVCTGWFIAFCTIEGVAKWAYAINPSPMKYKRGCIWIKPDSTPQLNGQGPAQGAECFVTAWCGAGYSKWNAGGKRGVYRHNVNPPDREGSHPTEKPWRLFVELLQDFTNPGQTILDPFMGSGTTLVACQKLGRNGIGIELDPDYFEIACRRVDEATRQPDLFIAPATAPTQEGFDL